MQFEKSRTTAAITSLENGFAARRQRLDELLGSGGPKNRKRRIKPISLAAHTLDLNALSQRFLPAEVALGNYVDYMRSLLPQESQDYIITYFFSGEHAADPTTLLNQEDLSDFEFSILCQTLTLAGKISDKRITPIVYKELTQLVGYFFEVTGFQQSIDSYESFREAFRVFDDQPEQINSLVTFLNFTGRIKDQLVHVFGPDLFSLIQHACDPDLQISDELVARHYDICNLWRCSELYAQLLVLRSSRQTGTDERPLEQFISRKSAQERIAPETLRLIKAVKEKVPAPDAVDPPSIQPQHGILHIALLKEAIAGGSPSAIIERLLGCYESDPSLMEWLDWDAIYRSRTHAARQIGLRNCCVHLLMGQPHIRRKFPIVFMAEGDGGFESALRTTINSLPTKTFDSLAEQLISLPPKCRALIVETVLDSNTAAMLSVLLQHRPLWAKQLSELGRLDQDIRASSLRSELASTFAKYQIVDRATVSAIFKAEESRLRIAYLQGRQLDGLVSVDWEKISAYLDGEFTGQLALVRRLLDDPGLTDRDSYRQTVATTMAERAAELTISIGPDNLRTTLSDALRHGHLPNRLLGAFDQAASHAVSGSIDGSELLNSLSPADGPPSHWLPILRNLLNSVIAEFNSQFLTVTPPSQFYSTVIDGMEIVILSLLDAQDTSKSVSECVDPIKRGLSQLLSAAQTQLKARLNDFLGHATTTINSSNISNFSIDVPRQATFDKFRFLVALRDEIGKAVEEVVPWIALTKSRSNPVAFQFNDLVQLCLINYRLRSDQRLNVNVKVSRQSASEGTVIESEPSPLNGEYFLTLETAVKNLLNNAFTRSGMGRNVRVALELTHGRDRIRLRCRNSLSPARYRALKESLPILQSKANDPNIHEAGEDEGSGLQKVRWAFRRSIGQMPSITLRLSAISSLLEVVVETRLHNAKLFAATNTDR